MKRGKKIYQEVQENGDDVLLGLPEEDREAFKVYKEALLKGEKLYPKVQENGHDILLDNPEDKEAFEVYASSRHKTSIETKDGYWIWKCESCGDAFELKEGRIPYECEFCHKSDRKTNFIALSGPYQYFDEVKHSKFIPLNMVEDVLDTYFIATVGSTIYIYNKGVYQVDKSNKLKSLIRKKLDHESRNQRVREVVEHIKDVTTKDPNEMGIKENKVVLKNGVLNLDTVEVEKYNPNHLAIHKLNIKYNPEINYDDSKFKKYLREWVPNEQDRYRLQEAVGLSLVNEKRHKKMTILVGPTDAGKSTFIKILRGLFKGENNIANQSLKDIANSRWGGAKLYGVMLNLNDETKGGYLKDLAIIKRFADGNTVTVENKGEKTFDFDPTCEHIYGANQTPTAERNDDAFWNRWIPISFPNTIPESRQDPDLAKKLIENMEGILQWLIEGYQRFRDNGDKFTHPLSWEEARDLWLNFGDSIQRFIQQCIGKDKGNKITCHELHDIYSEFAEENGLGAENQRKLTQEVKKIPYANYSENYVIDGRKQRGFKNVRVKRVVNKEYNTDNTDENTSLSDLSNGDSKSHKNKENSVLSVFSDIEESKEGSDIGTMSKDEFIKLIIDNDPEGELFDRFKRWYKHDIGDGEDKLEIMIENLDDDQFRLLMNDLNIKLGKKGGR